MIARRFILGIILSFFFFCSNCNTKVKPVFLPTAKEGKIDLSSFDFRDNILPLNGEWAFFWGPNLQVHSLDGTPVYENVPSIWRTYSVTNHTLEGMGVYRLNVVCLPLCSELKLKIPRIPGIYDVYLDEERIFSNGNVSGIDEESLLSSHPLNTIYDLPDKNFTITVAISVFRGNTLKGGMRSPLEVGFDGHLSEVDRFQEWADIFLITVIFSFGIYHLVFFFAYKKDFAPLYFGLFCFSVSIYTFITSEIQFMVVPKMSLDFRIRSEFFCEIIFFPITYCLLRVMFPNQFRRKWILYPMLSTSLFVLGVIFLPEKGIVSLYKLFLYFPLIYAFVILIGLVYAVLAREPKAKMICFTSIILGLAMINDVIYGLYEVYIFLPYSFPIGLVSFVALNSYIISHRFTNDLERTKEFANLQMRYNEQLKIQTEERSRIASDIHDSIGSELTAILFELESKDKSDPTLVKLKKEMNQLISNVRDIVFLMHHQGSKRDLVEEVMQRYCKRIKDTGKIHITFKIKEASHYLKIDECLHVQKIFLEIMANILRHGGSRIIEVIWEKDGQNLVLRILNDGKKFDPFLRSGSDAAGGLGLENIRIRSEKLKASLQYEYLVKKNTTQLVIPL
ncbi:sensor histidine kinase [Leptospira idonii]|uniref:histidine kinase n=1 Tax=Leptospira idonii TaxID=1193500 RepID=A0A4R9M2D3_9LEPT|nr:7TM diverse intracellular signaling domain-containing protein [Leptospira idonii]TGN20272.1 histidine kinase [Leptospira idonii]